MILRVRLEMRGSMRSDIQEKIDLLEIYAPQSEELEVLKKKLVYSKRGRSSKRKGASYESKIKTLLNKRFPMLKFARTPQSGGFQKNVDNQSLRGDLSNLEDEYDFLLHLELKNHKLWSVLKWYEQAESDCVKGKIPCVIAHRGQQVKDGKRVVSAEDFIFLKLADFLSIVDDDKIIVKKL